MSEDRINLKIVTHQSIIFDEEVDEIYSQGVDGRFGVLKNHVPFVTALDIGVTKIISKGEVQYIATMGGIFQFKDNVATILTDIAEVGDSIDLLRAKDAKARAEARLEMKDDSVQIARAQLALSKAIARISASEKKL